MEEIAFKQPTIAEVKIYMLKFVNSLSDKYPALLELDLDELAKNFVYAKEEDNWIAGDTDEYLKDWRMAAKREVIRKFDYIPFTEALDIKLTEAQELEIEDEMFIRCCTKDCDEAHISSKLAEIRKALAQIEIWLKK